jgi:cytochrome c biogenesis protein CcmG/thiol:disulfide interchange protein DsbE
MSVEPVDSLTGEPTTEPAQKRGFPWLVLLPIVLFAGLAGVFGLHFLSGRDPATIPSVMVGKPAPQFSAAPLAGLQDDGKQVPGLSSADLIGRVTIVNVFASWCVPCREEHPLLLRLAQDKRIRLVGLNYKDDPTNARRFLGQIGNPFAAVGTDPSGRIGIDWGVYGVPESFVIAPDGTIAYKFIGPLSEQSLAETLVPQVEKVLARK